MCPVQLWMPEGAYRRHPPQNNFITETKTAWITKTTMLFYCMHRVQRKLQTELCYLRFGAWSRHSERLCVQLLKILWAMRSIGNFLFLVPFWRRIVTARFPLMIKCIGKKLEKLTLISLSWERPLWIHFDVRKKLFAIADIFCANNRPRPSTQA